VLLNSASFERVLKQELDEDLSTHGTGAAGHTRDHHLLYCFHNIVQVSTEELPEDDGSEAVEDIRLGLETLQVGLDNEHKSLDLSLR
jgi:hypothetical protein